MLILLMNKVELKPCVFYQRGKCWKGDKCQFPHILSASDPPPDLPPRSNTREKGASGVPQSPRTKSKAPQSPRKTRFKRPFPPASPIPSRRRGSLGFQSPLASKTSQPVPSQHEDVKPTESSRTQTEEEPRETAPKASDQPNPKPSAKPVTTPGEKGVAAYKRGDLVTALRVFHETLQGELTRSERISLLSNRAHVYEKLGLRKKDPELFEKAVNDCCTVEELAAPKGHFKTTLLHARISIYRSQHEEAVRYAKLATELARKSAPEEGTKATEILDRALAARAEARKKADEAERRAEQEKKKNHEEKQRVDGLLDKFRGMKPWEILGVECRASSAQVKVAYRRLAMRYHPDRPEGDHRLFQKVSLSEYSKPYCIISSLGHRSMRHSAAFPVLPATRM
ncbi:hypothetical protein DL93DRAFT_1637729 [Clavulina sp. PMI_390]|nr:hypothetical protein DL93DRAFT_1637729 [Clavulina sp. PMI_390]